MLFKWFELFLSNIIPKQYCCIFPSYSYLREWQKMAKSISVGPQTISQSKFSSLKQQQKPMLTIQNLCMYMKTRRKISTACVQKFV